MILEALALLGLGLWGAHATGYDVKTGVQCKLCGWKYRVGEGYNYNSALKAEAMRMFDLHIQDKHPNLIPPMPKLPEGYEVFKIEHGTGWAYKATGSKNAVGSHGTIWPSSGYAFGFDSEREAREKAVEYHKQYGHAWEQK